MGKNYELSCEGLVCPLPVAKTKRKLLEIESGDTLEVRGDFAEAGENIKRYIERIGDELLTFQIEGEKFYLKIQKK